jgi:glycosyltransferase involved in cell wall biosynthesis
MRVVHLACVAPPETGGIGRVAYEEVIRLRERGIEADLGAMKADVAPIESVVRLDRAWRMGNAGSISWSALQSFVAYADVVHLHYPFFGTAEKVGTLRRKGGIKKLVITFHMDAAAEGMKELLFRIYEKTHLSRILSSADEILVSSKEYAQMSGAKRFVDSMIELPFGVDTEEFSPSSVDRSAFGIPSGVRTVGFLGGMDSAHAFKGVDVLLRALAHLPKAHAILAGDGDLRPSYEKLAQELGIQDRAHFVGRPSDKDRVNVYRASDVFAFPSTSKAEAFGLVALEAQSCGVPVVASDLAGVRTVVLNEKTGLLVPPHDDVALANAIRRLFENESERSAFGIAACTRVLESFTWDRHLDRLIEIYQKLCASPS